MRRHFIRLASAPFISSRLATFGWVRFPCAKRDKHNAEFTTGGWKLWSYFKPFVNQNFTKLSDDVGSPLYIPTPLPIVCVTFGPEDIRHLVSKLWKNGENAKVFWPPIFVGGTAPTSLRQFVRATYYPLLGKFGWVSFADLHLRSAKPGNEAEYRIYGGWVKMRRSSFKPFVDRSSWYFGTM